MKLLRIYILSFFILNKIFAQQSKIDSLKHKLEYAAEDTSKVILLNDLSWEYVFNYPDSAMMIARQALEMSVDLHYENGEIISAAPLCVALNQEGKLGQAMELAIKYRKLAQKSGNLYFISQWTLHTADIYVSIGDNQKGLSLYHEGLNDYNKALKIRKAASWEYKLDLEIILQFIGECYLDMNRLDSALPYLQQSYNMELLRKEDFWPNPHYSIAKLYFKRNQDKEALTYWREGLHFAKANTELIDGYIGLANVFNKTGLLDSSIYYAKKAFAEAGHDIFLDQVLDASLLLTDLYAYKHSFDSAFKYQGISHIIKDSLLGKNKYQQLQLILLDEEQQKKKQMDANLAYRNKIKYYALLAGILSLFIVAGLLWRSIRIKQKSYIQLKKQQEETDHQRKTAEQTLKKLLATQAQLIQSEKMASLGELTAGIAHEIQNPLNFMNNFSEVNSELIAEMKQEMDNGNLQEAKTIANNINENEQKINHHGKRADAIVKGMLQHSQFSTGAKEPTDINTLADEYLRLSYHGLRAREKSFNVTMQTYFDSSIGNINIIPQEIGRVLLNLYNNAFYAVSEKKKMQSEGYEPTVSVSTKRIGDKVEIGVKDNGNGIPQKIIDKIFQPFFTTKPAGQGTGLGLSMSYDIIKAYGGELKVETKEGEGAEFVIQIPIS